MKRIIILGTRPEIIKLSSIIRKISKKDKIIHTNQHYSYNMDEIFFKELKLRKPDYNLRIGSGTHGDQTARMLEKIEPILIKEKPDVVIVQGDTNSVLAGALAAAKLNIKVAHIEAGLRSNDKYMPEEKNRIITDHISDYLFPPTKEAKQNLLKEGINKKNIFLVGNTIVDATLENKKYIKQRKNENYILLTLHRAENVDDKKRLTYLISEINTIAKEYKIICPMHPRTKKMLMKFNLKLNQNIKIIEPQGYLEFLDLLVNAKLILTDSGGIQEEACILRKPCITLRKSTERPETIDVGANLLMSNNLKKDISSIIKKKNWRQPFGSNPSKKILEILND